MALHIQELCAVEKISVSYQSLTETVPRYSAIPSRRHITIRPTKNKLEHGFGQCYLRLCGLKLRIVSWLEHYGLMVLSKLKSRKSKSCGIHVTEMRSKTLLNPKLLSLHMYQATPKRGGFICKIVRFIGWGS